MSIEFRCHRCQRLLRTADDSGGKQTKCPECGTILDIPLAAAEVPELQTPLAAEPVLLATSPFAASTLRPGMIDIGDLFNRTWQIYSKNLAQLVLGGLILAGIHLALLIPILLVAGIAIAIAGALADQGNETVGGLIVIVAVGVCLFVVFIASGWVYGGFIRWMLKIARGEPQTLGDIFGGGRYLLRLAGAGFLSTICVALGYVLCIVPGVVLSLMFSQFAWLIVDRDVGPIDALSRSRQLTEGNKLQLFLLTLLVVVICGTANMIPFAFVFTTPFISLLLAMAYLTMSTGHPAPAPSVVPRMG